jgi:hypothetical protein
MFRYHVHPSEGNAKDSFHVGIIQLPSGVVFIFSYREGPASITGPPNHYTLRYQFVSMINLQLCAVQLWENNENFASVASVSIDTEFRRSLKSTLPTLRLVSLWSMKFQVEG